MQETDKQIQELNATYLQAKARKKQAQACLAELAAVVPPPAPARPLSCDETEKLLHLIRILPAAEQRELEARAVALGVSCGMVEVKLR